MFAADVALQGVRASGRMDTAATSITSGEHHRLADARSRPRQKHTHTHARVRAGTDNHISHKCLQRRWTSQSGRRRTASKCSGTLFLKLPTRRLHVPCVAKQTQRVLCNWEIGRKNNTLFQIRQTSYPSLQHVATSTYQTEKTTRVVEVLNFIFFFVTFNEDPLY